MKMRLFLIAVALFVIAVAALVTVTILNRPVVQTPEPAAGSSVGSSVMSYQGVLNNASGTPATGNYSMTFSLYHGPVTTTAVWSEVQANVAVSNGLFNVYLGDYTPIPPSIFNRETLYLGVAVAGDSEMTPRTRIAMVPYAYTSNQVACLAGLVVCNSACVNTQADAANCGACGTACKTGAACTSGICTCPGGTTSCSNACADLTSDPGHCGSCAVACPSGDSCVSGQCLCPAGNIMCTGACVNPQTDKNHCGSCGTVCQGNQTCVAGACQ